MIARIRSLQEWTWPQEGEEKGFINIRLLLKIGIIKKWSSG